MKKLLLILLLLASSAMGQTDISSLPYTISTSGTYNLTVDDTVTATAITINADNVILNLNGHTIGFGSSEATGSSGIYADNRDSVFINGPGTINHVADDSASMVSARGINLTSGRFCEARGISINMSGYCTSTDATGSGIRGIRFGYPAAYMCKAVACTVTMAGAGYYDRAAYPSIAIYAERTLATAITDSVNEYHLWVDSCVIDFQHTGVNGYGHQTADSGYIWISNTKFTGNVRQDISPWAATNGGYRIANCYAIYLANIAACKIWNNVISYGTSWQGGAGIGIESSVNKSVYGFSSYVYNNACTASVGGWDNTDGTDNVGHGTALRIRYGNMPNGLYIHDNTFVAYSDSSSSTTYRNGRAVAGYIGTDGTGDIPELYIYNNKFLAIGSAVSEAFAIAIADKNTSNTIRFYNNLIQSNNTIFQLGFDNGPISYLTENDDTLEFVQDSGNFSYTYDMSLGAGYVDSFTVINNVYGGGAYDTNIYIYPSAGVVQEILVKYTITVTAEGNNSYPVENASVWCVDGVGDTVFTGTTNASGQYTDTVQTWYEEYGNTDDFNDFVVGVAYSGDSTYSASTVSDSTRTFTRVLASTAGTAPSEPTYIKKLRKAYIRKGKI